MTANAAAEDQPASPTSRLYAHYVLGVLCVANILNIADRNIMGLLMQPIKNDLHASDTAMSLLSGASFVLFYALFGIPIAQWSDRSNRRNILAAGVALWSLATAACGFAASFVQMAFARAGVGVGEATGTPTSLSLIADYYSRSQRPQMVAVFNLAQYLGSVAVTPILGIVTDLYSWREAFFAVGVPGVVVSLLIMLTVREPQRGAMDAHAPPVIDHNWRSSIKTIMSSKPFVLVLLGTAIINLGSGTLGAWGPALAMRAFHVTPTMVASIQAPLSALVGVAGTLAGGYGTAWVVKRRKSERWLLLLPALVFLPNSIGAVMYAFAPNWPIMIAGGLIGGFTNGFRTSPHLALSLNLVPANCRGMAAAANVIAASVVGQAGGPLVVGMISDALTPEYGTVLALRIGMLFAPAMVLLGLLPIFIALKYFNDEGVKPEAAIA